MEGKEKKSEEDAEEAVWTLEEKDQLFQFITKVGGAFTLQTFTIRRQIGLSKTNLTINFTLIIGVLN